MLVAATEPATSPFMRLKALFLAVNGLSSWVTKKTVARHRRCDVYCGARETVGGSSVSSGCWGEDSNHEYGWARRTPTYVAPIRFLQVMTSGECPIILSQCTAWK